MTKHHLFAAAGALLSLVSLAGCAASGPSGFDENASALPPVSAIAQVSGQDSPVVVLQSGLGDGQSAWSALVPQLSRHHTVVTHDRPGRGQNPYKGAPRDPCSIATEQRALLQRAGLQPPYILVGHSLGGLYQYVYARMYHEDVAGLVLLDPTHPRHWETLQRDHAALATLMKTLRATVFSRADRAEFDAQTQCLDRLPVVLARSIPTRLLVSGIRRPEEVAMLPMLDALREDWRGLLGGTPVQVIQDAGHHIQQDRPRAVLAAIDSLPSLARSAVPPSQ